MRDLEFSISLIEQHFRPQKGSMALDTESSLKGTACFCEAQVLPAKRFLKKPSPFRRWEKWAHFHENETGISRTDRCLRHTDCP